MSSLPVSKLLVLDFDGTMTDAEEEGRPFRQGYLEDLAALTGWPQEQVLEAAARYEAEVQRSNKHGWIFNGQIVAPATVDPYLRIMPVARMILDDAGVFVGDAQRDRLLDAILFKYNYRKTSTCFRPQAGPLLRALAARPDVQTYVVTNSHTEPVQAKIQQLDALEGGVAWLVERVRGRAQKYVVDDHFDAVPAELRLEGLERPVLLRRPRYYEALDALRATHGLGWADLTVVGDIFELDLALPLALGARIGLAANAFTPAHERAWLAAHPRATVLSDLSQALDLLGTG